MLVASGVGGSRLSTEEVWELSVLTSALSVPMSFSARFPSAGRSCCLLSPRASQGRWETVPDWVLTGWLEHVLISQPIPGLGGGGLTPLMGQDWVSGPPLESPGPRA